LRKSTNKLKRDIENMKNISKRLRKLMTIRKGKETGDLRGNQTNLKIPEVKRRTKSKTEI
jgi:phage regulator Rha-like protein